MRAQHTIKAAMALATKPHDRRIHFIIYNLCSLLF
jgi:hypothetical protein